MADWYKPSLINARMGLLRMSNEAVARRAGVSVAAVSYIRNGRPNVKKQTIEAICDALGLDWRTVIGAQDERAA